MLAVNRMCLFAVTVNTEKSYNCFSSIGLWCFSLLAILSHCPKTVFLLKQTTKSDQRRKVGSSSWQHYKLFLMKQRRKPRLSLQFAHVQFKKPDHDETNSSCGFCIM